MTKGDNTVKISFAREAVPAKARCWFLHAGCADLVVQLADRLRRTHDLLIWLCSLQIDYKQHGVQVVMEGTGVHLTRAKLQPYFDAGAAKVVVSAPVKEPNDPVLNIVVGCNDVRPLHS